MASRSRGVRAGQGRESKQGLDEEADLRGDVAAGVDQAGSLKEKLDQIDEAKKAAQAEVKKHEEKGKFAPLAAYDKLDAVLREESKYGEQLLALLTDPAQNLIEKAGVFSALHPVTEPQPRVSSMSKARNPKRSAGEADLAVGSPAPLSDANVEKIKKTKGMQRSASVASQGQRDRQTLKLEDGADSTRGSAAEKAGRLQVGAAVMYKRNINEGEGILCTIKSVSTDGLKQRMTYLVQDDDPNEQGTYDEYKASAADLTPLPKAGSSQPTFAVGRQVLARYPETTTFYKAEVMSINKNSYTLKFEGEETDKEMVVDRHFVLDLASK
ncbi:MAG: hypothetical protein Q9227_001509 [Pyrenula ochraceoflavens]